MRKLIVLGLVLVAGLAAAGVWESAPVTSTPVGDPQFRTEDGKAIRPRTTDAGILLVSLSLADGGTTSLRIQDGDGSKLLDVYGAGDAIGTAKGIVVMGSDGANARTFVTDTSGRQQVGTTPMICTSPTHSVTSVGTSATSCPSAQLASRRGILLCNSAENSGGPKVKVRVDGTNPTMGIANPGDVLGLGDCFYYPVAASVTPKCIADTASTAVTGLECQ